MNFDQITELTDSLGLDLSELRDGAIDLLIEYGFRLFLAALFAFLGFKIVGRFMKFIREFFLRKDYDPSLESFITSFTGIVLKVVVLVTAASIIGIPMTSFVALLGTIGFAIGLSLQGSLANFAGGALILFFQPYKVGDYIEVDGMEGSVKSIQIFYTVLTTLENKRVILPNGNLSNSNLINHTAEGTRRLDIRVGVSYDSDIKKAKKLVLDILKKDKHVLSDPEPEVFVAELADSAVVLTIRPWVSVEDLVDVQFSTLESIHDVFRREGVEIPYPHRQILMEQIDSK